MLDQELSINFNPHYLFVLLGVIFIAFVVGSVYESKSKRDIAVACINAGSTWNDQSKTCEAKK